VRAVFVAAAVAFVLSIFGTPIAIRLFTSLKADQPIRAEGPQTHLGKKGTPTMGGVVFIFATFVAYMAGHLALGTLPEAQLRDDYLKVTKRNSLGLNKRGKLIGQAVIGAVFGIFALYFPKEDAHPLTVASSKISFVRDIPWLDITKIGAVLLFVFVVMAMSNAVNLTDGLDGLATGTSVMVLGSYALIAFWQYRHWVADDSYNGVYAYDSRDPLEIALIAASAAGACVGFLWWNAAPARIFMGDTGSMGLGALIAGLAAATKTVMLLPILTILYFIITVTWVMQIGSYRTTGKRIFRMVPLQHHFELAGWSEVNIVIRFWIIAGLGIAAALGLFYADFLRVTSGSS
jgi:phospho-N-acetylmuramoyl-pentapeptide-transferase